MVSITVFVVVVSRVLVTVELSYFVDRVIVEELGDESFSAVS